MSVLESSINSNLSATLQTPEIQETDGSTTGSAIYVGIVGEAINGEYQTFDRVEFTTAGEGIVNSKSDSFSFDDMTIANVNQLKEVAFAD